MIVLLAEDADFNTAPKNLWDTSHSGSGDALSETDLHYTLFPARVTFEVDGTTLIGPRRRVPLFDFLACIARLVGAMHANRVFSMGFTEAADRVDFRLLLGGGVEISTSERGLPVQVDRLELVEVLTAFLASRRQQLVDNVPGIQRNPHMGKLSP